MIPAEGQPIWYEFIEYDNNLKPYLREDATPDARKAFAEHQAEIERMNESGERVEKAKGE